MKSCGFEPDWVSPPGDTIVDILEERNLSLKEFSRQMGLSSNQTQHLLNGEGLITNKTALTLNKIIGGTVQFWTNRESQYRTDRKRLHVQNASDAGWLGELPVKDMFDFGWLKDFNNGSDRVAMCLRFFNSPTVSSWRERYHDVSEIVAFRTSPKFQSNPGAVAAWLRQGEIASESIICAPWDASQFKATLDEMRSLCRRSNPSVFLPQLTELCAKCGVALAVVKAPSGCRASGATRFLSPTRGLMLLSFRYLTDDQFWFTFFHEAGHLLLHGNRRLFLEGVGSNKEAEEAEANKFAEDILIPPQFAKDLAELRLETREILTFAKRLGVSPGIIIGQLQHGGRIAPSKLNSFKRRYQWGDSTI